MIGGFRTGMEMNGHECVAFCEIDKYARQSYKAMYETEGEEEWHDITQVSNDDFRAYRGRADVITGGFPCQAFSLAGKRRGFEDTRGTLFFHIARAIKEIQPSYALLENVKGLFSHDKGRTFGTIIQALDELGYVTEWGLFNSKFWGVPQNRERVYILVTRKDIYDQPKLFDLLKQQTEVTTRLADVLEDEVDEKYYLSEEKTKKLTLDQDLGGKLNMYDYNERDKVYSLNKVSPTLNTMQGGDRQPKIAVPVLTPDRENKRQNGRRFKEDGEPMFTLTAQDRHGIAIREATKKGYKVAKEGDSVNLQYPGSETRRGRVGKSVANTLEANGVNQGVVVKGEPMKKSNFYAKDNIVVSEEVFYKDPFEYDYEYIDPEFRQIGEYYLLVNQDGTQAEVLIKLKDGVYETIRVIHDLDEIINLELITPKDEMGRMGEQAIEAFVTNSCVPGDTINAYNRTVDKSGLSPTLTTRPEGFKTAILPITEEFRIRKLTPLECWRLQGFTDEQFYKAKNDGVSNSQLYKQAGNSVTVNVIDAIAKRL